ncbi:DUF309 domain-containing protein [Paenibacillus pinisoli]|uniref:DUF309 domain-containing protein n=1 Tax=Paenibacillus pinisoli TaxID=1276110 RepID=A0A3A6P9V3_9BACL|nr:DUF309 domain-containing protein [Paenibacillus pinisoli]RJX37772.1 DUF309 domain-containing protein [Paenibacillus pinisoli]
MGIYPDAYIAYLVEFHANRDYFECHELLEEYWKEHPDDGMSDIWVGLIQIAVGQYHERRGNRRGAVMMYKSAERKLADEGLMQLGIDAPSLQHQLAKRREGAESGQPYKDMEIKLLDHELLELCRQASDELGVAWGTASPMGDADIIHRHLRRDRTEVVAARQEALLKKQSDGRKL